MLIALTPCKSKMLEAHGHHADSDTLAVRFGPGKIYHYQGVPASVYADMQAAESVGSFFAKNIRGQYPHEVIVDEPEAMEASD